MIKIESVIALIERGATDGEKQAARNAYKRLTGKEYIKKAKVTQKYGIPRQSTWNGRAPSASEINEMWKVYDAIFKRNREEKTSLYVRVKEVLRANQVELDSVNEREGIKFETYVWNDCVNVMLRPDGYWMLYSEKYDYSAMGPDSLGWHIKHAKGLI